MTHQRSNLFAFNTSVHRCASAMARPILRRRGNVLILVVALLVLMALAGTAYLATVRVDRTSTAAGSEITQTEMLLDSVQSLIEQKLINDLPHIQRANNVPPALFQNWDHPSDDKWLADRIPTWGEIFDPSLSFPIWRFLSYIGEEIDSTVGELAYRFDSPFTLAGNKYPGEKHQYLLQPTSYTLGNGTVVPAMHVWDAVNGTLLTATEPEIAADADGDGIADAPYFQLPGRVGDITYYAGVRVVDNAAAINVNTAWDRNFDLSLGVSNNRLQHYGAFPGNIGLIQLLADYSLAAGESPEGHNLNKFRLGYDVGGPSILQADDVEPWNDISVVDSYPPAERPDLYFQTQAEALWTQVARRLDNPGYLNDVLRFRSYPISEMMGLAYRFILKDFSGEEFTLLERPDWGIPSSIYTTPGLRSQPYDLLNEPTAVNDWFAANFDYDNRVPGNSGVRHIRPLLVTHNPVGNLAPVHVDTTTGNIPAAIAHLPATDPFTDPNENLLYPTAGATNQVQPIARTSINTATFGELWRAFWAVMHQNGADPIPNNTLTRMFRGEHTAGFTGSVALEPYEMLQLRAALAAVNAEDLRDFDDDVREHVIQIGDKTITVFGTEKQVFITEAVIHLGGAAGPEDDYIAIELYSPYEPHADFAQVSLTNWQLAAYDRAAGTFIHIHTFGADDVVVNREFLVIESSTALRPADIAAPTEPFIEVSTLVEAIGKELVLLRPRLATGTPSGPEPSGTPTPEDLENYIPADQIDLTDLSTEPSDPGGDTAETWHYARLAPGPGPSPDAWKCVYPGAMPLGGALDARRILAEAGRSTLGEPNLPGSETVDVAFSIPLNDFGWPGPRYAPGVPSAPSGTAGRLAFPYGGFARDGDILMTPFIGAYTIRDGDGNVVAMNAVTIDAGYAEEIAPSNLNVHVGRFAPIGKDGAPAVGYEWAEGLFEHLTAHQNPDSDYLPNVNPDAYIALPGRAGNHPQPVPNGPVSTVASANQGNERGVGTHGLININTAPPQVLNMLPLTQSLPVTAPDFAAHEMVNREIANAIWWQQRTTPFKSPFELLRVPEVLEYGLGTNPAETVDLDESFGDVTPYESAAPAGDGVVDDFEQHYLPLTRLSNLITTRSDSYTVYIVLEGWRNAGTPEAERVSQRRRAFIVDRSGYTQTNPRLNITPVPVD